MSITNSNFIHLIGNLGDTPSSRTLPNGQQVINFNLATNDSYKNREGERIQRTEWHQVKAFGKTAEVMARYLRRGSKVSLVGTLRYRKWVDKFEQKRLSAEVIVESFEFMDAAPASGQGASAVAQAQASRTT